MKILQNQSSQNIIFSKKVIKKIKGFDRIFRIRLFDDFTCEIGGNGKYTRSTYKTGYYIIVFSENENDETGELFEYLDKSGSFFDELEDEFIPIGIYLIYSSKVYIIKGFDRLIIEDQKKLKNRIYVSKTGKILI